jgi:polysaccharide biosynthesis protein PslG
VLPRLLCTPLLVLLALAAAPAAHALPAPDIAGVALHPWQLQDPAQREQIMAGVAATGVRSVRVDMPWSWVEASGPTVESGHGNWTAIDPIVQAADQHGLTLLPVLGYTPSWASDVGDTWALPDPGPFEDFFAAALRRYPQIPAWELWNEPNLERFSKPQPDPERYVELLRSARRARDGVGSSAKLISGGLAPGGQIDVVSFVDQMAMRGGLDLVDGLGIHPYSVAEPDSPGSWMMQLEALHDHLAGLGHPGLALYLTEYGAPTVPYGNGYGPPLTEAQQADRLRTAFALATRFDWVRSLTWYEYRDSCADAGDPECHFGLVHANLSAKPSYAALGDVVAGATARLHPRLSVSAQIRRVQVPLLRDRPRGRRSPPRATTTRVAVSGRLMLPATAWPNAPVTVLVPRSAGPPRVATAMVKEGVFWVRFDGRDLRLGTVEVRYGGSASYLPATARAQTLALQPRGEQSLRRDRTARAAKVLRRGVHRHEMQPRAIPERRHPGDPRDSLRAG